MDFSFYIYSVKRRLYREFANCDNSIFEEWATLVDGLPKKEGGKTQALFCKSTEITQPINEFSKRYSRIIPEIQKLPAFLDKLNEGDYFFYIDGSAPFINHLCCANEIFVINDDTSRRMRHQAILQKYGQLLANYTVLDYGYFESIGFLYGNGKESNEKIRIGKRKKQTCRFCHKDYKQVKFKEDAHAIPESLGNDLLFCNEECDECNSNLAGLVENNLVSFLDFNRAMSYVETKDGIIPEIEGDNFFIRRNENGLPQIHIIGDKVDRAYINDGIVRLEHRAKITDNGIYKALCKIVIDLIPSRYLCHFNNTVEWINGIVYGYKYPSVYWKYSNNNKEQPYLWLFLNDKNKNFTPFCTCLLSVCNMVFLYIVPYVDIDEGKFKTNISLSQHWPLFLKTFGGDWNAMDLSKDNPSTPHYDLDISEAIFQPLTNKKTGDTQGLLLPHKRLQKREYVEFPEIKIDIFSQKPSVEKFDLSVSNQDKFEGKPDTELSYNIGGTFHIDIDRSECVVEAYVMARDTTNTIDFFCVNLLCKYYLSKLSNHMEYTGNSFALDYKFRDFLWFCTLKQGDTRFAPDIDETAFRGIRLETLFDEHRMSFINYYLYENNTNIFCINDTKIH